MINRHLELDFSLPCNEHCKRLNFKLYRVHASCMWCSERKSLKNPKYKYNPQFGLFLPPHFDARTAILNNGTGYIIYTDDDRLFKSAKEALLNVVFFMAESTRYNDFAKILYLICECLST